MKLRLFANIYRSILILIFICLCGCGERDSKIRIKFSTWGSETEINILKPVIDGFEKKYPNVDVDLIHIPQNYFQKLHMMVAANLTPDVIFINNMNIPIYDSANILEDLNPYIERSDLVHKKSMFAGSLETMSYRGKLLALPRDISNVVIYFNKDLFDRFKIRYPETNWTIDDMISKGMSIKSDVDKDGKTDIFGISFEPLPIYYLPFVWSNGGNILNDSGKEFILEQKAACSALQEYSDLRNKYSIAPKDYEAGNNTMAQLFMQGKLAMYISGRWNVPKFREVLTFNWEVINFPSGKDGSVVGLDSSGWAISRQSKNKEIAWKFIEYLDSKDVMEKMTATGLITPARKDIASSTTYLSPLYKPENAIIFLSIASNSKPTPKIKKWNEVIDLVNQALEPVWSGNQKACVSLKLIKQDVNELLN